MNVPDLNVTSLHASTSILLICNGVIISAVDLSHIFVIYCFPRELLVTVLTQLCDRRG